MRGRRKAHLCFPVTRSNLSWELHRPQQRTHTAHPLPRKKSAKRPPESKHRTSATAAHPLPSRKRPPYSPSACSELHKKDPARRQLLSFAALCLVSGPAEPRAAKPQGPELLLGTHSRLHPRVPPPPMEPEDSTQEMWPRPICPTFPTILSQKAKFSFQPLKKISPEPRTNRGAHSTQYHC